MLYTILSLLFLTAPLIATTPEIPISEETSHQQITTADLKKWYDQKKKMVVIDARSQKYFDGTLLPNAKWLPADSNEQEIQTLIPEKNSLVVIYCNSITCPLSGILYDKLKALGYSTVYEYHEGLKEWLKQGLPTTKQ